MSNRTNLTKVNPLNFLSEVKTELSKVVWPSREETIRLTAIVIVVSIILGLFVGGLDYLFTSLTGLILKTT
ncbi:MAG: hypothetical protein ACD_57C00242G0001 [uncultured bacterium]|nr:MAG: hypothetical protein ACD_57C00242G0001 [uncultured bacterium]